MEEPKTIDDELEQERILFERDFILNPRYWKILAERHPNRHYIAETLNRSTISINLEEYQLLTPVRYNNREVYVLKELIGR